VINEFQVKSGNRDAFNQFQALRGLSRNAQYEKLQEYLNMTEFIDYLLLQYYSGNQDHWREQELVCPAPPHAARALLLPGVDGEQILQEVTDDTVNDPGEVPFHFAQELRGNPEFRLAFADRVQKHFFNDGALTPAATAARWKRRADEVDLAIIAESARWGYYRRNPPFTRDADWLTEQQRLLKTPTSPAAPRLSSNNCGLRVCFPTSPHRPLRWAAWSHKAAHSR